MLGALDLSYIILWCIVIVISISVFAILREAIKVKSNLYEQQEGLPKGSDFPLESNIPINGSPMNIRNIEKIGTLIFLTSTGCLTCSKVYPIINDFQKNKPLYQYLIFMMGTEESVNNAVKEHNIKAPVVRMDNLKDLQAPFVPFGYFVSQDGVIRSKGVVNNEGHIQSLILYGEEQASA
ncbi:Methylamine utilization protein MauD [compost metagenome]